MRQATWMGLLLIALLLGGCTPQLIATPSVTEPAVAEPAPMLAPEDDGHIRILFIGNTHTSTNKGLDAHLAAMAASADLPFVVETESVTQPGASLDELWAAGAAVEMIRKADWDVVILQAATGRQPDALGGAVEQFADLIVDHGALPMVLVLRDGLEDDGQGVKQAAGTLSLPIINPAAAWGEVAATRPDLALEDADYPGYPSIAGTYLDTAVLYAALFGQTPKGLPYRPVDLLPDPKGEASGVVITYEAIHDAWTISDADAAYLQQIAWAAVQNGRVQRITENQAEK